MRSAATRMSLVRIEEMHVKTMEQRLLEGVPSLLDSGDTLATITTR